jgi:hypothetical protein
VIPPAGTRGASAALPLAYLVTAAAAFVTAAVALPLLAPALAGHYYHPSVLALTHTITLGWITMTILGASYQLIPVLLERPIASPRLAAWQLVVYAIGVIGVVGHFALAEWRGFAWSAALVLVAALTHVVHAGGSVRSARPSFTRTMMLLALAGFALTAAFGGLLGLTKVWRPLPTSLFPTLHAHVQLALLGWVLPTVLAVASRVYPMFLLASEPTGLAPRAQLAGIAVGVPLTVGGLLAESTIATTLGALFGAAAVAAHLATILTMVRTGKRPRLDYGLRFVLAGAAHLAPAAVLGVALAAGVSSGPRAALAYGVLALGGWASLTIVGMMLKIVPFLVWYRVYGPRAGRGSVPTLAQLSWSGGEAVAFATLTPGMAVLALAAALGDVTLLRLAGTLVALGAVAFGVTLARVLSHLMPARANGRGAALGIRVA